jgi:hypothetical protein
MAPIDLTSQSIKAIYRTYEESRRPSFTVRLGASVIADDCWRKLYYDFRWVSPPEIFDGRKLRLFKTGDREEDRMMDDLRNAGMNVWTKDDNGKQFEETEVAGHFVCRLDGVVQGLPEAPNKPHIVECKTHNEKNFRAVKKHGVQIAQPKHFGQVQIGMHLFGMDRGYYMMHNKNDDEIDCSRIHYDMTFSISLIVKAERIIFAEHPPAKLHENVNSKMAFVCGWCKHKDICHNNGMPERNCRTCMWSRPTKNGGGEWVCDKHSKPISRDEQKEACNDHIFISALIPGEQIDANEVAYKITYRLHNGATWINERR